MKILITGQNGFIGSRLIDLLKNTNHSVDTFKGDVTNASTFNPNKFDIVIHLASLISHKKEWSENDFGRINVEGTRNICDFYKDSKIIYISTKDVERINLNPYSQSKLEAEKIVQKNNKNLILRLPSVFGPNQKQTDKLIPRLFRHFISNEPVEITNNDEREYIYLDAVCQYIIENISKNGVLEVNGVNIRNMRLKELIESVVKNKKLTGTNKDENILIEWLKKTYEHIR